MSAADPRAQPGPRILNRKQTMKHFVHLAPKRLTQLGLGVMAIALLGACAGMSRQNQNTAIGAGVGAVGGAVLTGGSAVGTVGGAAIGGIIGNQIEPRK